MFLVKLFSLDGVRYFNDPERERRCSMFARLTGSAVLLAIAIAASPLKAQESLYEDHPVHGLHFSDLEFSMPRDPLLPSTAVAWSAHHTPSHFLVTAVAQLRRAIPFGTNLARANEVLQNAGAHCKSPNPDEMLCLYRGVETPEGEFDAIEWNVKLTLANGQVTGLAVTRDWWRH
jgi:hypothetical protein